MPGRGQYRDPGDGTPQAMEEADPRDDLLLIALLAGRSYRQAAEQTGYSERTVERRMADPGFKRRVMAARAQRQQQSLAMLAAAVPVGIETLVIASQGWEETVTLDAAGAERRHREPVPWTARIQAATKLVELGVGSLARVQVEVGESQDGVAVEDELTAKLEAYAASAPPELRLLIGGGEGVPASEQVVDTTAEEAQ
jgi:hypothetical protein